MLTEILIGLAVAGVTAGGIAGGIAQAHSSHKPKSLDPFEDDDDDEEDDAEDIYYPTRRHILDPFKD